MLAISAQAEMLVHLEILALFRSNRNISSALFN